MACRKCFEPTAADLCDKCDARQRAGNWNPRPHPDSTEFSRNAYLAGYADGFHHLAFGTSDGGKYGGFSDYRPGHNDGHSDAQGLAA